MNSKMLLPKKDEDISKWYLSLIDLAELADYGPAKGTMVIRPYAYAIWEKVQEYLDGWFKEGGVRNAYFPLFIPYSLLEREKQHVSGFSPELAVVTIGGGKELTEKLVVRPTSETIMYEMFSQWISSYKDLPLKINQWTNVVRWELRTFPFLRTSEFLWQEGHTVHRSETEAMDMVIQSLEWYKKFYEEVFALAPFVGEKSGSERFAGAQRTFSLELVMPDGKALQAATSHMLGQNFSKAFNITFLDEKNAQRHPYQTSWGLSTRSIGGLIMSHGDDNGLILPPLVAPYQVVLITINSKDNGVNKKIQLYVRTIEHALQKAGIRYTIYDNQDKSLGYRINEAEIRGIPIRMLIGLNEYEKQYVTFSRRDIPEHKEQVKLNRLGEYVTDELDAMQLKMKFDAIEKRDEMVVDIDNFEAFTKVMENERKFIRSYWCESSTCEDKIKEKTKATTRIVEMEFVNANHDKKCVYCGNPARRPWLFAQAY